jgi:hypothetical protein
LLLRREGQSVNPASFSKLQETGLPVQPSNPCTLCGSAVVLLERYSSGMPLGTADTSKKVPIPLTVDQADVGMVGDNLNGDLPAFKRAVEQGKIILMQSDSGFRNMQNKPPDFAEVSIPSFYDQAGPQGDQKLLTPAQRRQMMILDAQKLHAAHYIQRATAARDKTKKIITGPQYHRGIVGVDTSDNVNSEVYGEHAREMEEKQQRLLEKHIARADNIAQRTSTMVYRGNIIDPESIPESVKVSTIFQSKASRNPHTFEQTKEHIFGSSEHKEFNVGRAQKLRDEDIAGRNYNFVTHTEIRDWPSSAPQRIDHRMVHPSQTALENVRNLQGSLRR